MSKASLKQMETLHNNLATYLNMVIKMHLSFVSELEKKLEKGKMGETEFAMAYEAVALPANLLSTVTSLLKSNNITVDLEEMGKEMSDYTDKVKALAKKNKMVVADMEFELPN